MAELIEDDWDIEEIDQILKEAEYQELIQGGLLLNRPPQPRFGPVNSNEIQKFIVDQENENTRRKTQSDVKLFRQFLHEQGEDRPLETIPAPVLDQFFGNFLTIVKKTDNTDYEPSSIRGFLSSFERHLRQKGYTQNVNKNGNFPHTNNAIKAKMAYLKSTGHGNKPNEAAELTDADIEKLHESGQLGTETPYQIVNLLHMTFSLVMGLRGGREQHQLKWGDIQLFTDEDGERYLQHTRERQTKTRTGIDPNNSRKFKPKAFQKEDTARCPVVAYLKMKENRPEKMCTPDSPFFLSINNTFERSQGLMFKACAMGINHIYGLVKKMTANSGAIDKKLTNHSVRKHLLQKCNDIGLPPNQTIQISGHKNIGSVNNYSKMNHQQQKEVAKAISDSGPGKALVPAATDPFHQQLPCSNRNLPAPTETALFRRQLPPSVNSCPAPTETAQFHQQLAYSDRNWRAPTESETAPFRRQLPSSVNSCPAPTETAQFHQQLTYSDRNWRAPTETAPFRRQMPSSVTNCPAPTETAPFHQQLACSDRNWCAPTETAPLHPQLPPSVSNCPASTETPPQNPAIGMYNSSQTNKRQMEVDSVFQGTTVINGGTFNFYGSFQSSPKFSPVRTMKKYRRILRIVDSDSDEE